jgi:glucan endo-1,3-alpha-glucosidase
VEDFLWAVVFLTSPAEVTLSCGPSVETTSLQGGASKLKLAMISACDVAAKIDRDGEEMLRFEPAGFRFTANPPSYNFNAFVAASPLSPASL